MSFDKLNWSERVYKDSSMVYVESYMQLLLDQPQIHNHEPHGKWGLITETEISSKQRLQAAPFNHTCSHKFSYYNKSYSNITCGSQIKTTN